MAKNSAVPAIDSDEEWKVREDMRTLVRAEEIRKSPKRLAAARAMAKKEQEGLAAIAATKSTK